jgi:hypothetical protein
MRGRKLNSRRASNWRGTLQHQQPVERGPTHVDTIVNHVQTPATVGMPDRIQKPNWPNMQLYACLCKCDPNNSQTFSADGLCIKMCLAALTCSLESASSSPYDFISGSREPNPVYAAGRSGRDP